MLRTSMMLAISSVAALLAGGSAEARVYGQCRFDSATLRFAGSTEQTASCLLRKVREKGGGADEQPVPAWLRERVTKPFPFSVAQLERYLRAEGISASTLSAGLASGNTPAVRYFVIHDTSSPEITRSATFPGNINEASWSGNNLNGWGSTGDRVNLIISRDGRSRAMRPWGAARSLPATKLEQNNRVPSARRAFVHVENIQPRIKPPGSWSWKAPTPGFSAKQEKRLAVAYFVASLHAGRWLIPAYHFNIDQGVGEPHDDPQHADLASWVAQLAGVENTIVRGAARP